MYKYYIYDTEDVWVKTSQPFDTKLRAEQEADLFIAGYTGTRILKYEVEPVIVAEAV